MDLSETQWNRKILNGIKITTDKLNKNDDIKVIMFNWDSKQNTILITIAIFYSKNKNRIKENEEIYE